MKLMMRFLSFLILAIVTFTSHAQITYESSDFYGIGDTINYSVLNEFPNDINFDTTGANITWNYLKLDVETQRVDRIVDPVSTGYRTNWCLLNGFFLDCIPRFNDLTNLAGPGVFQLPLGAGAVSDVTSHYKKTDGAFSLTMLGINVDIASPPIAVPLANVIPDTIFEFPLNYLNVDSTSSAVFLDGTGFGQDFIYDSKANRVTVVEGWGTLVTPFKTYTNVLKIKSMVEQIDTIKAMGQTQPIASTTLTYTWLDKDSKFPVLEVQSQSFGAITIERILYEDTARCIIPEAAFIVNPRINDIDSANGTAEVDFVNRSLNGDEFYWDFGDGTDSDELNPSHTFVGEGIYPVQMVVCNTVCNPLICDTFNINVVVRDTSTTSLYNLNEVELNDLIKVFPNPTSDYLNIQIDPSLDAGILYYQIFNLNGQALKAEKLIDLKLEVNDLFSGMYILRLTDLDGGFMHFKFRILK
jgi:PKD repeat protein